MIRPKGLPARYELKSLLGSGAFGKVYLAHDKELKIDVAVKISPFNINSNMSCDDIRRRAKRELRASGRISHPNIVKIYSADIVNDYSYIVMEVISGCSLETLINKGPIEPAKAFSMAHQLADALDHLHGLGIIHRDVKSANILVGPSEEAKLMDFNLVSVVDETAMTATGSLVGTPIYIAPEVFEGKPAHPSSDVYALGVVLWSMLTGQRPFDECKDFGEIIENKLDIGLAPPSTINPLLSPAIDFVVRRATSIDLAKRYSRAADLSNACSDLIKSGFESTHGFETIDLSEDDTGVNSAIRENKQQGKRLSSLFILTSLLLLAFFAHYTLSSRGINEKSRAKVRFSVPKVTAVREGTRIVWQCSQSVMAPKVLLLGGGKELEVERAFGRSYSAIVPIKWRLDKECHLQLCARTSEGRPLSSKVLKLKPISVTSLLALSDQIGELQIEKFETSLPLFRRQKEAFQELMDNRQSLFHAAGLTRDEKLRIYKTLLLFREADVFLLSRRDKSLFNLGNSLGLVNQYVLRKRPFDHWEDWPKKLCLWRPKMSERYLLPKPPISSSRNINFFTNLAKTRPKIAVETFITGEFLNACQSKRALLFLCVKMPSPTIMLRVTINGHLPMLVWGQWVMSNVNRQNHIAEFPLHFLKEGKNQVTFSAEFTTASVSLEPTIVEAFSFFKGSLNDNLPQFEQNGASVVDRPKDSRPLTK